MKPEEEPLPHPPRPLTEVVATVRQKLGGTCGHVVFLSAPKRIHSPRDPLMLQSRRQERPLSPSPVFLSYWS